MYTIKVNATETLNIETEANSTKGKINGSNFDLNIVDVNNRTFHVIRDGKSYTAEVVKFDSETKTFLIVINGNKYTIEVRDKYDLLLDKLGMGALSVKKVNVLKAPMPGLVLDVRVGEGTQVKKGDALVVLEAMKMENIIKSPTDGVVKKINITKGKAVEKNEVLINFL
jgi:acetyl/propionyl-CoA carboxylase alpha subunit